MVPYGLRHQVQLPVAYTAPIPGAVYDPIRQLATVAGVPLVRQPELMRQYTVTWGTPNRDNQTDEGG